MGIPKQDPEYLRAKYAFIRDLIQFHESRGTGLNCDPKINGKEVDLYLLYQIVTSHGGWEKINLRNEWDKLLEHFHLPRSTNGGIAIKQIYLRYLELYEKIHFLGEDIDAKEDHEDEYEDFRGRRRYPNSLSSRHSSHHHHHHSSSSHHQHGHGHHQHHAKEIADHNRSQLGLSSRILQSTDYEGLLLSLQSPLPNEQDMAISVCTLLSNETKHVLHFSKSPAILNMLLAHAGIYQDCGMRVLMEETYRDARNLNHAEFWDEVLHHPDVRQLLCECYVKGVHSTLGLIDDEGAILSKLQEITDGNLPEEEKFALGTALRLKLARVRESRPLETSSSSPCVTPKKEPLLSVSAAQSPRPLASNTNTENEESGAAASTKDDDDATSSDKKEMEVVTTDEVLKEDVKENPSSEPLRTEEANGSPEKSSASDSQNDSIVSMEISPAEDDEDDSNKIDGEEVDIVKSEATTFPFCCSRCVCQRTGASSLSIVDDEEEVRDDEEDSDQFSIDRRLRRVTKTMVEERRGGSANSLLFTKEEQEKVGQRIYQIAHILRNLSFEHDNALVMAQSPTLMRFLILSANCSFGSLAQASFDIIGNIASHIQLEEPLQNPLSSMLLTLVTSGIYSEDRFKILRSLEALRELTKCDGNEGIITRYIDFPLYERICDLLTLSDIMLLIYTLECMLSMTGLGEAVCDEIVRVQGSVATLVSLVTVEAQSYGPKGCIQMRVVETVTGAAQQHAPASSATQSTATAAVASTPSASLNTLPSTPQLQHQQQAVIHVPATQHLLQQQLQQPPNPIYASPQVIPSRPSPSNSPGIKIVSGTTTIVPPVVQGQHSLAQSQQIQKPGVLLQNPTNGQVFTTPTAPPPTVNSNHLNSSSTQQFLSQPNPIPVHGVVASPAVVQKPSVLPSSNTSHAMIKTTTATGTSSNSNGSIAACVPQGAVQPPPPGATMVIQQQPKPPMTNAVGAASALNGATTLVTASVPQISNHNMSQHTHVVTPSISLVTPRGTLSEEAWAVAWLKGTFESSSGTSIEQGEIYRMYSAARKNPQLVLSLEQFVQCVKCAYGGNVGPVIKQFGGGTSLSFFEGIKPKISIRAVAVQPQAHPMQTSLKVVGHGANAIVNVAAAVPATNTIVQPVSIGAVPPPPPTAVVIPPQAQVPIPLQPQTVVPPPQVPVTPKDEVVEMGKMDQIPINNNNNDNGTNNIASSATQNTTGATLPVSVHIPSREAKPSLSPILQATLSQPPKTKNNNNANTNAAGSKQAKSQKRKEKQPCNKKRVSTKAPPDILCQKFPASPSPSAEGSKGNAVLSPASSAIRSLLASKVAQRQQNKLQQQLPKNAKGKLNDTIISNTNAISKDDSITPEVVKVNGVGPDGLLDKAEESSASSSVLSSDGSDNVASNKSSITSFHGVLHNGQASLDPKNDLTLEGIDDPESLKNRGPMKGMLIDLLERRVPSREPVNGVMTGREIRISEKGLELIDKMEETLGGPALLNHSSSTCTTNDAPESQKMTFYSSTSDAQVTLQGQAPSAACVLPASVVGPVLSSSSVTLASGVSGAPAVASNIVKSGGVIAGQQVKLCGGNIVEVIEQTVGVPTTTITADATVPAMETPAVIAEVEVESTDAPIAPAFSLGDGLATSATATNGGVTYVVSDSTQSSAVLVDVDSVIAATAHSAPLVVDGNVVVVDGGEAMIVEDSDGNPVICNSFVNDGGDLASSVRPTESNISNGGGASNNGGGGAGGGSGDLLEKFSQFSDLIVVPPEQLASLKRPSSPIPNEENSNPNNSSSDLPPPAKKQAVDSSLMEVTSDITSSLPSGTPTPSQLSVPVVTSAGSVSTIIPPTAASANNGTTSNVVPSPAASNAVGSTTVVTTTTPSLPPGAGAQVVQLPLRLSVNPQNPQQLTFTRQLVLPSGQQVLLSTANSQSSPLQGQVIISKTQGSAADPMPKAIIILQQQQQSTGNVQTVTQSTSVPQQQTAAIVKATTVQQPATAATAGANTIIQQQPVVNSQQIVAIQTPMTTAASVSHPKPQIVAVQQHPVQRLNAPGTTVASVPSPVQAAQQPVVHQIIHQKANPQKQQTVIVQQQLSNIPQQHVPIQKPVNFLQFEGIKASSYPHLTPEQLDMEFPFMCEWAGCGLRFLRPQQVSMHALKMHCPEAMVDAVKCEWGQNGCDPLLRKRFSLMTHLQDRHCSKQALELALYRRKNRIDPPPIPQQPLHHPGYAPNAAFHAIKRHAMAFMSTKEHLHDDNEGPVTKSIRLTSALILRNLVNYSAPGRRILRGYESHLSGIAMSNVESSRTIAQLLHDMNERPKSSK